MSVFINPFVHSETGKSRTEFLRIVSGVKEIRSDKNQMADGLTVYIASLDELNRYRHIKDALGKGDFAGLDGFHRVRHFGIEIADPAAQWLLNCDLDLIIRQITCWLAALYAFDVEGRSIMERQIYAPILEELIAVSKTLFAEHGPYTEWPPTERLATIYATAALNYYGSQPPSILGTPGTLQWDPRIASDWGVYNRFDFQVRRFWMRESDWKHIVIEGTEDDLIRSESSEIYWNQWKHQFSAFDASERHKYSLFEANPTKGFIYLIGEDGTNRVKIGYTGNSDIERRRSALQTGNSSALIILGSFPCASPATEKLLHEFFAPFRKSGEWFELEDLQAKEILDPDWRREHCIF